MSRGPGPGPVLGGTMTDKNSKNKVTDGGLDISWQALDLIKTERLRQIDEEGYHEDHDDKHEEGELALMAAAYALSSGGERNKEALDAVISILQWDVKPKDRVRDLVRAGALILAELERVLRR